MKEIRDRFLRCRQPVDSRKPDENQLDTDLHRYLNLARELGVAAAAVMPTEMILVDPRAKLKCRVPPCSNYGTCANCPPYTPGAAEMQEIVGRYRVGLLLRWDLPRENALNVSGEAAQTTYKTLAGIEAAAFYDGYYFACGFASGPCRRAFCPERDCRALADPVKGCRFPLLARPSMEACGFDVYGMAGQAGWPLRPAGRNCPGEIETLYRIGLVLVT